MSEVKLTFNEVRESIKKIEDQINILEGSVSDISSAYNKLLLDDIFSLENYSIKLFHDINLTNTKIKKIKKKLEVLKSNADTAIKRIAEADENSSGNQTGASVDVKGSKGWLKWMGIVTAPEGFIIYSMVSIIGHLFLGDGDSSGTEITSIAPWKEKDLVEEKAKEVHSYYEEIMAHHEEWLAAQSNYTYEGVNYTTISGFRDGIMKQSTNYNCTSTAWCYGDHLITGHYYSAEDTLKWPQWGADGAQFPEHGEVVGYDGKYDSMLRLAYSEMEKGKPCVFYGNRSKQPHAVTIVGVVNGVDASNLKMSDFLVVDPADGKIKRLDQVGYKSGIKTIAYK